MSLWSDLLARLRNSPPAVTEAPSRGGSRDLEGVVGRPKVRTRNLIDPDGIREFVEPEIDFATIEMAIQTDSYVEQAIERYLELMFKSGWDLVGSNPAAVQYVRDRFAIMAEATQLPTEMLLMEMAEDIVCYANCITTKRRDRDFAWPSGMTINPLTDRGPVVGYFPINVSQMLLRRNQNGVIQRWRQEIGDVHRDFSPEDIVHIFYRRPKGEPMGRPFLTPAIADVRALRQAEEQVLRLIYRNLFPFVHGQVGNEDVPAKRSEIDQLQQIINNMDLEGGLATSERVNLNPVAVNQIIDAYNYLLYFEKRVFTALGVSEVLMGRAASASRASAENLSVEMRDRIKALQRVLALGIDNFMIHELLLEGGFDPILNPNDDVDFVFNEIDLDSKIKNENQAVYMYEHNAITEEEMRNRIGKDPITDDAGLHLHRITIPRIAATRADTPTSDNNANDNGKRKSSEHASPDIGLTPLDRIRETTVQALYKAKTPSQFVQALPMLETAFASHPEEYALFLRYKDRILQEVTSYQNLPVLITSIEAMFDCMQWEQDRKKGDELFAKDSSS